MICWLQVLTMEEIKRKVRVAIEVTCIENRENAEAVQTKREYDMKVFKTCSLVFASILIVIYACFIIWMTNHFLEIVFAIITFFLYFGVFMMLSRAHKNMKKVF